MTFVLNDMKKNIVIAVVLFCIAIPGAPVHLAALPEIANYLPRTGQLGSWEPSGKPQEAEGEDLFLLINGGAEVFHEYGFKRAIISEYKNKENESARFNIEIYEMTAPHAAYGVFTFKTGETGKILDLGPGAEALMEDYYLSFWKGDFFVTVIGFDSNETTLSAITSAAKLVASNIAKIGQKPRLVQLLPLCGSGETLIAPHNIKYIKGNLGLFNNYQFDSRDIFGVKEGVIGFYKECTVFIFQYPGEEDSREWFLRAVKHLKEGSRFSTDSQARRGDTFSMRDKQGRFFHIEQYKDCIVILVSRDKSYKRKLEIIKTIRKKI